MASYWMQTWDQENWPDQLEWSDRLDHTAGDGFVGLRVQPRDAVYVVGFDTNRMLILLGGLRAAAVGDFIDGEDEGRALFTPEEAGEALGRDPDELWEADAHVVARDLRGSPLAMHHVFTAADAFKVRLIDARGRAYDVPTTPWGAFETHPFARPVRIDSATARVRPHPGPGLSSVRAWRDDTCVLQSLVIVVATALVSFLAGLRLERLRWRREDEARAADRRREVRRALRLVEAELFAAETRIAQVAESGMYAPPDRRWSVGAWETHRDTLAVELGCADWHLVTRAYDAITALNGALDYRLRPVLNSAPENAAQAVTGAFFEVHLSRAREEDGLEGCWRATRTASWILRSYLGEAGKAEAAIADDNRGAAKLWPRRTEQPAA